MSVVGSFDIESFTFYSKSGFFYLNGFVKRTVISNNEAILEKGEFVQLKFDSQLKIAVELFTSKTLVVKLQTTFEQCQVKGLATKRFQLESIEQNENCFRQINQQ